MASFSDNYHRFQSKAYNDIKNPISIISDNERIITSGRKPFWWSKRGTFYVTVCNRIAHIDKNSSNGQLIQPEIFANVKDVILVKGRIWAVLFQGGEFGLFEEDGFSNGPITMKKIGSVSDVAHLINYQLMLSEIMYSLLILTMNM